MNFDIYHIKSPALKPYVQYILFNYSIDKQFNKTLRSFANTNFCLGIVKDKMLSHIGDEKFILADKPGIHSYLTGIYTRPFDLLASGPQDEICIDFTPQGYYKFFRFQPRTYILEDDVLKEAFEKESYHFFENVFEEADFQKRGDMIETFLTKRALQHEPPLLLQILDLIGKESGNINVAGIAQNLRCSERKIHRQFVQYFDIGPKEFIRVMRFRKSIRLLRDNRTNTAADAYELGYADQSHLIKEVKYFTGFTPKKLFQALYSVDDTVLLSIQ